jgi:asparagine synthase (glutamine-hydrolysing)
VFAAILNVDERLDRKIDLLRLPERSVVEIAGASRRTLFAVSHPNRPFNGEWRGIERLGDRFWLVGRVRLDGRQTLRDRLDEAAGSEPTSDGLLCLRAYAVWGEGFLERLAGDFCFALWDEVQGKLVAARDQLGVRVLFHAEAGSLRLVSDSLDWLAGQEEIAPTLDEYWIADFLCAGRSLDFHRTVYRDAHRLPPGHLLRVSAASEDPGTKLHRYWRLDIAEPLYLPKRRLYSERFRELVATAVGERLPPAGKVGISMSGGLDSTTLAAFAMARSPDSSRVVAQCLHYERLMPDEEAHFSALAARHLGIDLHLRAADDVTYDPQWRTRAIHLPEPSSSVISAHCDRATLQAMAALSPVWLYGEGPDNALYFDRNAYLSWLADRRDWPHLAQALLLYALSKGVGSWARTVLRYTRASSSKPTALDIPPWLDRDFVDRLQLQERMRTANDMSDPTHGWHPQAVGTLGNPVWQKLFDDLSNDEAMASLEWRHPFLDLRVLEFMLSVPPVPWAREKMLMREAMRGLLPDEILRRKKAPLAKSPIAGPIAAYGLGDMPSGNRLAAYVDRKLLPTGRVADADLRSVVAAHALDHWMMYDWPQRGRWEATHA